MKHNEHNPKRMIVPILLMAIAVTGLAVGLTSSGRGAIHSERIWSKICFPLGRLLVYLGVGLLIGQILEASGWTAKLGQWVRPITRWGRLKDESGAAFISSFVSGIVANTLLMGFHTEGKLTRKELILTYLLNTGLPIYLVHLPTTFFIVASLAGTAGIVYVCIGLGAALMRSVTVLLYCRMSLPKPSFTGSSADKDQRRGKAELAVGVWKNFRGRFLRLALYTLPIYILIFLINEWGFFVWLRQITARWVSTGVFPVEAAGVVIFTVAAEFSSGMAAAGALAEAGALTVKQTALALILGTIVATPIRAIRHQLPTHVGIFNLGLGSQLLLLSQAFRVVSLILVTVPYLLWG